MQSHSLPIFWKKHLHGLSALLSLLTIYALVCFVQAATSPVDSSDRLLMESQQLLHHAAPADALSTCSDSHSLLVHPSHDCHNSVLSTVLDPLNLPLFVWSLLLTIARRPIIVQTARPCSSRAHPGDPPLFLITARLRH